MARRLEEALSREIVIITNRDKDTVLEQGVDKSYKNDKIELHENVLAQAKFSFLPRAYKVEEIEQYKNLEREMQKTKAIRDMLENAATLRDPVLQNRLMSSSQEFLNILNELDGSLDKRNEDLNLGDFFGTYDRIKKTSSILNEETRRIILERYGIQGV